MKASKTPVEDRYVHIRKYVQLALVAIMICCVMMFAHLAKLQSNETAAINNAEHQANITTNSDICKSFPQEPLCILAKEISADPTKAVAGPVGPQGLTGPKGDPGNKGLGVQEFITDKDGRLIVTFSDGSSKDLGTVQGVPGAKGDPGAQGVSGRGIIQTSIQDGQLVVAYTDGKTEAIGNIIGPVGAQGPTGDTGLTGETGPTGQSGTTGKDGLTVTKISNDLAGEVTVTYSDGSSAVAGTITDTTTITKFECIDNTLFIQLSSESEAHSTEVQCVAEPLVPVTPTTP